MRYTAFNRRITAALAAAALLAGGGPLKAHAVDGAWTAPPAAVAQEAQSGRLESMEMSIAGDRSELSLELAGGRSLELGLRDGRVWLNGEAVGEYREGGELDRSWRELLQSLNGSLDRVASQLVEWAAPDDGAGPRLDIALENALSGAPAAAAAPAAPQELQLPAELSDSMERLNQTIAELQRERARLLENVNRDLAELDLEALEELDASLEEGLGIDAGLVAELREEIRREVERELRKEIRVEARDDSRWTSPVRYIWRGLGGIFSTLAIYAVLVGLGFALVFFGRTYLEGVADTARHHTVRSLLVGMAGSFLMLPAYFMGGLALVISIVGIPLSVVWIILFPVAVGAALLFGYLGVGHAAGEALAERRFYGGDWFKRANSYYYILTGVGLLLVLFLASSVAEMAGPWFGFIQGLLRFLAVALTWAVFTIGFGAVLLSRAGTRPLVDRAADTGLDTDAIFEEESHV